MNEDYNELKNQFEELKAGLIQIENYAKTIPINPNLNSKDSIKKRHEVVLLTKFIVTSGNEISVVDEGEAPDFIIEWQNEKYGLEIVEIIDPDKKRLERESELLIADAEKLFKKKYENINSLVNISLKTAITEFLTDKEIKQRIKSIFKFPNTFTEGQKMIIMFAELGIISQKGEVRSYIASTIADYVYSSYNISVTRKEMEIVNYVSFQKQSETQFSLNRRWCAGSIDEKILEEIRSKELKHANYQLNSSIEKQCLLIVISGDTGSSDYAEINVQKLKSNNFTFDKIYILNSFSNQVFEIKS